MSDNRDRLIELCNKKIKTMQFRNSDEWFDFQQKVEQIADYLIANGVIVLPCKVGDKLYKIEPDFEKQRGSLKIQEYTVTDIIANALITRPYTVFKVDRIGADVFITSEEAEKASERSKGNA